MITDYSKMSMRQLVNAYQNYINDAVRLGNVILFKYNDVLSFSDDSSIHKMYELTMCELNSVLSEIIKRLNLKKEK